MNSEFLEVAVVGKTVGLKGQLKLNNKSDFINQFKKGAIFYDKNSNEFEVESFDKAKLLIKFTGYNDIDSAKILTNKILYTTKADTIKNCKLKKDEFFYFDIIGCKIVENNQVLGIVEDIEKFPMNHMLLIKTSDELTQKNTPKNFYIPYNDRYIISVDIKNKTIFSKDSIDILENS